MEPAPSRPDDHRPASAIDLGRGAWIAPSRLHWSFSRSGGPGGQHVNKTSTKATLRIHLDDVRGLDDAARARLVAIASSRLTQADEIVLQADESRSQLDNREAALRRLRAIVIQAATPPKIRRKTKPTRGSKERRLKSKKRDSEKKSRRGWSGE